MRLHRAFPVALVCVTAWVLPAIASPRIHRGPAAPNLFKRTTPRPTVKPVPVHISSERAIELQTALIKAGYLTGAPSGVWDAPTQAAMEKLQGSHGWQTKLVPDSRAIIALGLGASAEPSASAAGSPTDTIDAPSAGVTASSAIR